MSSANQYKLILMALASSAFLVSCSSSVAAPTVSCSKAFNNATTSLTELYATHPIYTSESDALYADGVVSVEEQSQLDQWLDDSNEKFERIISPIYEACTGIEDLFAGAYVSDQNGYWGVRPNEAFTLSESKELFLSSYCSGHEKQKACSDYVSK